MYIGFTSIRLFSIFIDASERIGRVYGLQKRFVLFFFFFNEQDDRYEGLVVLRENSISLQAAIFVEEKVSIERRNYLDRAYAFGARPLGDRIRRRRPLKRRYGIKIIVSRGKKLGRRR